MSNRIANVYSNFLEYEKRMGKKSAPSAASSTKGFMAPTGSRQSSQQSSSKYSELAKVADIVSTIRKSREA